MRGNRRLLWAVAVAVSVLLHGLLLGLYVEPLERAGRPLVLEIALTPRPTPEPAPEPIEDPPPELDTPDTVIEPEPDERETAIEPEVAVRPEPVAEPAAQAAPVPPAPRMVLNLERPSNWDELVESLPGPDIGLHFNPSLERSLRSRQAEQQRSALVAQRAASVYGVADEAYSRQGGLGTELKQNGRCVTLVETPAVEEGSRWWVGRCRDTKINPFLLPAIEYDALGRAIGD